MGERAVRPILHTIAQRVEVGRIADVWKEIHLRCPH
jgi:hypothetical protein